MTRASSVLKEEIEVLELLNDLADRKRTAVFKDDLAALQSVIAEEEAAAKRLGQLEETRLQQAGLFSDDEQAEEDREKLRRLLHTLKTKNEFNQTVLRDALAYTRFMLQLVMGVRQPSVIYGAGGRLQETAYRRIIDKKG